MQTLAVKTRDKERDKQAAGAFQKIFHKQPKSYMDVFEMSKEGVTKDALMSFVRLFNLPLDRCAQMLPITLRTIQRYSGKQKFSPSVSEHIIQLAFLMVKGIEVFESREKFMRWFDSPSRALGGKNPSELVSLKAGIQMVMDELIRIEYGVYA